MTNYIILRTEKEGKVITASNITAEEALHLKDYITDIFTNQSGGISIIITIELF